MTRDTLEQSRGGGGARRRQSLRWRLPVFFGTLVVLVLAAFLWATYRQVERTLVQNGADRAGSVAGELADRLGTLLRGEAARSNRLAADPALRAVLARPTAADRDAAAAVLPETSSGLSRVELWSADGAMVLEHVSPSSLPDTVATLRSYPALERPVHAGVGRIRAAGEFAFFDRVTEVRDSGAAGAATLGYMRQFGRLTSSGMQIDRLLGDDAAIRIGSADGGAWTDLVAVTDAPPARGAQDPAGVYRAADGRLWVGGEAAVEGTPWTVWVGYPRAVILAPAHAFMRRMLVVALLLVAAGVLAAAALAVRLTRPLHALARAAEEIAGGDYTRRVATASGDEIGRLSQAFNTMSRRIEEVHGALREKNEQTHFALAAAHIGVWECHLASGGIRCSESMGLVLGLAQDALPRTRDEFLSLVHADDRTAVRSALEGRGADERGFDVTYRAETGGSVRWIEGKARLRLDASGAPVSVLGVAMDVSERHRLEALLRQAQKMEAVGQLAGGVAHDFNNLLTAIVGHGNLVLAELEADTPVRDDVVEILRAGESAAGLTRQLLTFSRRKLVVPRVVELHSVVAQTERLIRRLIDADIGIVTDLSARRHTVRADPGQLEQVIVNLAVNARDAMPEGGTLTIATRNVSVGADDVLTSAGVAPGPYVVLSVSDTGIGMDAETQARLFEPFFTTKAPGKGTGLGLATVFGIVRQSSGHIFVSSEVGRGTTFDLYLPATPDPATSEQVRAAPAKVAGGGEWILVVEDNDAVRAIARTILERAGYRVTVAADGEEALRTLATTARTPDLVLTDIVMPGMSGADLCREIRLRYGDVPVLFTSGYAGESLGRHGVEVTRTPFIEKPYSPASLTNKVREALAGVGAGGTGGGSG